MLNEHTAKRKIYLNDAGQNNDGENLKQEKACDDVNSKVRTTFFVASLPKLTNSLTFNLPKKIFSTINKTNFTITQPSANKTSFVNEYNSQIKSICIITGNPSFKSSSKESFVRPVQSADIHNSYSNMSPASSKSKANAESDHPGNTSNFRVQNIYDANYQEFDMSPQTNNYNCNNSVNTIDLLELEDSSNETSVNTPSNKQLQAHKNFEIQHKTNISTSINSLNSLLPTNVAANTMSINGSIGDDTSATSEVAFTNIFQPKQALFIF